MSIRVIDQTEIEGLARAEVEADPPGTAYRSREGYLYVKVWGLDDLVAFGDAEPDDRRPRMMGIPSAVAYSLRRVNVTITITSADAVDDAPEVAT